MDTSDPDISFDSQGQCNHCREYLQLTTAWRRRADSLKEQRDNLVQDLKRAGEGTRYDCIVGLSGGGDSSYVAYLAQSLGLRVLAVHMDNGWNTPVSVRNVKSVVARLGIDYESVVLDWEEFRDLQLAFLKASVPEIETPTDIALVAALHQVAAAHRVKHVISGGNIWTEGILPKAWHYDPKDMRYLRGIHRRFGTGRLRTFPKFGYRQESYYKLIRGIRLIYLLEYVPYETAEIAKVLRDELGWRPPGGKHHESTITRFVQSYILPRKFGFDYRRATFSTRICAGGLCREQALAELENPPFDPVQVEDDKQYVAKKFGVTVQELDAIIALPPKSFADYPNDQKFLQGIYEVYRRFFSPRRNAELAQE
jgi:N-acetyl sugar amidotransferase